MVDFDSILLYYYCPFLLYSNELSNCELGRHLLLNSVVCHNQNSIEMDFENNFQTEFQLLDDIQNTQRLFEEQREIARVPRAVFRDQENPLESLSESDFKANLAFSKDGFLHIFNIFKKKLKVRSANENLYIPPLLRLYTFLEYVRGNGFYRNVGKAYYIKLPKSSICRIVNHTAMDIASFKSAYIRFPDVVEREEIADYFMENFEFPGIIGIYIKCYFVKCSKILKSAKNAYIRNEKLMPGVCIYKN